MVEDKKDEKVKEEKLSPITSRCIQTTFFFNLTDSCDISF